MNLRARPTSVQRCVDARAPRQHSCTPRLCPGAPVPLPAPTHPLSTLATHARYTTRNDITFSPNVFSPCLVWHESDAAVTTCSICAQSITRARLSPPFKRTVVRLNEENRRGESLYFLEGILYCSPIVPFSLFIFLLLFPPVERTTHANTLAHTARLCLCLLSSLFW